MSTTTLIHTLADFSLFHGFEPEEIDQILSAGRMLMLDPGETLIAPGTFNNSLFLVVDGELRVILEKGDVEVSIPIPPGECLGEMSLIEGTPTTARVRAHQPSRVLALSEETFWNQLAMTRSGVQNLLRLMVQRLQRNNDALIEKVEKQMTYQLMERELETAGKIQSDLVPDGSQLLPEYPEIDAFALINQARSVGGDFFDAIPIDEERVYFAIGDVSGKGMPAALFMMRILTSIRFFLGTSTTFDEVMPTVNNWLSTNNEDMMFVSVFAGILNVRTGKLQYVNAGHNPPFISLSGEPYKLMGLPKGTLLGIAEDVDFPVTELQLQPGDSLVLYTDGITEAQSTDGMMFDTDRAQHVLSQHMSEAPQTLAKSLETAIAEFVGPAPQHDDYTIFALRWVGGVGFSS